MKLLLAAAFEWRTLIWLGLGLVASLVLSNPFPAVVALGIYLWAVQRLANSDGFKAAGERARVAEGLAVRYRTLQESARSVLPGLPTVVPAGQHRSLSARAGDVLNAAHAIYHEWLAHPDEHADKSQVVDEAMQLALLYLRIVRAYQAVYAGHRPLDLGAVEERLARNRRKLESAHDLEARRMLTQAIDMDGQVLTQSGKEEADRERYQARLAAIESAMDLYRRQLFDPESTPEGAGLRDMLLEAQAMDEALSEVQETVRIHSR
ncbi:MAG TPA: hypothetical protein VGK74_26240 [Symbiobacteriaceae bacterium]|jgi:hypothetical protein